MLIKLIKIGNSYGIRLPKNVIKECQFEGDINLELDNKKVILSAYQQDRNGWIEKIQQNSEHVVSHMEAWKW